MYFQEMGRVPLLTGEEEVELARTIAEGQVSLREAVFRSWTSIDRAFDAGRRVVEGHMRPESFLSEDFVEFLTVQVDYNLLIHRNSEPF